MAIILFFCTGLFALSSFFYTVQNVHILSVIATLLGLVFSSAVIIVFFNLAKNKKQKDLQILRKLIEYIPFISMACFVLSRAKVESSPYTFDLLLGLIWFAIVILSIVLLLLLKDKRLEKAKATSFLSQIERSHKRKKTLFATLLEWVDALVQALCLVLLLNIFIFQLYTIPSESMVPEFMIGDRVLGFKTPSGAVFPLSSFQLPQLKEYKRGDLVIFTNPNYPDTPDARLKTFISQLIYMMTFTRKNINTDEFGRIKADPLVKRIVGVPGEKIMLVDGVLYAKRATDQEFSPIEEDKNYATWDLASLPQSELRHVRDVKFKDGEFNLLESVEAKRKDVVFAAAAGEARSLVDKLSSFKPKDVSTEEAQIITNIQFEMMTLFTMNDDIGRLILTTNGGLAWFNNFMTGWVPHWIETQGENTLYEERFAQLNVLIKICFGKLILRNLELFAENTTKEDFLNDSIRLSLLSEAQEYAFYLIWTNQRNMNEFPSEVNDYIPPNNFFMMGDNRFNSTDMRHSYMGYLSPVDKNDAYSILFTSNLSPKYVSAKKILGTTAFRFWPPSRMGVPR